jgi:protein-S-isoprenylcysteine O-methyltransferase Ste14
MLDTLFDEPFVRFAITGTLISAYGVVDHLARRQGSEPLRARVRRPGWIAPLILVSVLAFYVTIRPQGGAWLGGLGNLAGLLLATAAAVLRWLTRFGSSRIRQPEVAARMLLYAAMPMAVGVASGALTLTLPAVAVSAWWCVREDRLLLERHGAVWSERIATTAHWVPRVW